MGSFPETYNDQFGGFSHGLNFDKFRYTAPCDIT